MADPPAEAQGRIFISYRRDDSAYPAGWLYDRLAERFGAEQIFKDVDSIELGEDFVQEIGEAVGQADVLLALIGERWLNAADEHGGRRLDDPDDFVRIEVEAALERKVRVIPILVEGAGMPREEQLPQSLRPLARRQALELSPARFSSDTGKLLAVLERTLAEARAAEEHPPPPTAETTPAPPRAPGRRSRLTAQPRLLIGAVAAALLLGAVIGGVLLIGGGDETSPTTAENGTPRPPPENGLIAYVSDAGGAGNELWEARSDGSPLRQLTTEFAEVRNPDWSPDGTKIAFASNRGNESDDFDLWVVNAEGSEEQKVTDGVARDGAPSWSPDGCTIAFGRAKPGGSTDIWIVDAKGRTEPQQVTADPADDDAPDWSTTNLIAFESRRDDHDYDIYTLDPTGREKDVKEVTKNEWDDWFPDWSPDGGSIAYRSYPRGEASDAEIFMIDVPDGQEQRLTINDTDDHRPDWSPDGRLIAFDAVTDGTSDIHAVRVETSAERPLISGDPNDEFAAWGVSALEPQEGDTEHDEACTG